jgi:hypothetical protein
MLFEEWIDAVAMGFGTTQTQTAMIVSFLTLICLSVLVLIAMGRDARKLEPLLVINFSCCLMLVYFDWLPNFLGTVMAIIFAMIGAVSLRDRLAGS